MAPNNGIHTSSKPQEEGNLHEPMLSAEEPYYMITK